MKVPNWIRWQTEAETRSPTRKRVPGRTWKYVEELDSAREASLWDSAASWKEASCPGRPKPSRTCKDEETTKVCK